MIENEKQQQNGRMDINIVLAPSKSIYRYTKLAARIRFSEAMKHCVRCIQYIIATARYSLYVCEEPSKHTVLAKFVETLSCEGYQEAAYSTALGISQILDFGYLSLLQAP